MILAEHSAHTLWWPHGTARCDLAPTMHTMHVVSPPMVDSGTSAARPVSKDACERDTTAGGLS